MSTCGIGTWIGRAALVISVNFAALAALPDDAGAEPTYRERALQRRHQRALHQSRHATPEGRRAPELDPTAAGAAMILLAGGWLLFHERRRRQPTL
jgi:hypothetical protein